MQSVLNQTKMRAPLNEQSCLKPSGRNWRKDLAAALMLTSLVDVFSILVIYLLVNTGAAGEAANKMRDLKDLPVAKNSAFLDKGVVLRIKGDSAFIEGQEIRANQVLVTLDRLAQSTAAENRYLIIQGDKQMNFDVLSPYLIAAGKAGFSKVRFAVIKEGGA